MAADEVQSRLKQIYRCLYGRTEVYPQKGQEDVTVRRCAWSIDTLAVSEIAVNGLGERVIIERTLQLLNSLAGDRRIFQGHVHVVPDGQVESHVLQRDLGGMTHENNIDTDKIEQPSDDRRPYKRSTV